jgi:hypothetical protein
MPVAIMPMNRVTQRSLFDVSLHVSRQEVEIAEPLELTIRAIAPSGWQILPPVMPADLPGMRVIGSTETTEQTQDRIVWTRHVALEAYAAGRKTISPVEVTFAPPRFDREVKAESSLPAGRLAVPPHPRPSAGGRGEPQKVETRMMKSAATVIDVRSALGLFESGSELRPIYDPVALPWTWRQWAMGAGGAALIVGCGWLVIRWVNRFHDDDRSLSRQSLLRELARLKEAWLQGSESDRETAVAASEIARRWLSWRQGITIHRTTDDWAALVLRSNVAIAPIVDILGLADRVKFAQVEPTLEEVRDSLERLRQVMHACDGARRNKTPLTLPSPSAARFHQAGQVVLPAGGEGSYKA